MSISIHVEGTGHAEVITAIAIETEKGRPFRAVLGAQVGKFQPRECHTTVVLDTTLGKGGA